MACSNCSEELGDSIVTSDGQFKSCPECSRVEGRHAFYATPGDFGVRNNGGYTMVQSWCRKCRPSKGAQVPSPAFLCGDD